MSASAKLLPFLASANYENTDPVLGEKRLLAAVLAKAVHDAVSNTLTVQAHHRRSAREWLCYYSNDPKKDFNNYHLSFFYICEALDLNPELVHKNVVELISEWDRMPESEQKNFYRFSTGSRYIIHLIEN